MQDTKVKTKALDEGNCGAARSRGKEAGVKAASPRTETGCEAGGADELARQSEVPVSATQVKSGVVPRKSRPLPGETCPPCGDPRESERHRSTATGNSRGERTGVSRGRSSARSHEPGVGVYLLQGAPKAPEGLTPARRTELIRECGDRHGLPAAKLVRACAAEKDRAQRGDLRRSPLLLPENRRCRRGSFDGPCKMTWQPDRNRRIRTRMSGGVGAGG